MVQRLKINQFYGAPTAIRLLLKYGDQWVQKYDRSTLKTLGTGTNKLVFTLPTASPVPCVVTPLSVCSGGAHQHRSVGVVSQSGRRGPLSSGGHLVANW